MYDEPAGVRPALQSSERRRCPTCQQVQLPTDFATSSAGRSSFCLACRRAAARLASRRRAAAMRLLIALHSEEWAGLLGLVSGHRQPASHAPAGGGENG
jgi:hypothetical protein